MVEAAQARLGSQSRIAVDFQAICEGCLIERWRWPLKARLEKLERVEVSQRGVQP